MPHLFELDSSFGSRGGDNHWHLLLVLVVFALFTLAHPYAVYADYFSPIKCSSDCRSLFCLLQLNKIKVIK